MTTDTKLLPCPFCGANAHFEMDDARWEWVECESCGMQSNRRASLMEDCKPTLADAWNTRAERGQPAYSGEPVYAFRRRGQDDFCTCTLKRYKELSDFPEKFEMRIFYTAPQPVEREPLTDEQMYDERQTAGPQLLDLAKLWADNRIHVYQFVHEAEKIVTAVARRVEAAHGIKGGQHGNE